MQDEKSDYYPTAHESFKISGSISNNKGWNERFFFIGIGQDYRFNLAWSTYSIYNTFSNIRRRQ